MHDEATLNPWLNRGVIRAKYRITGPKSFMRVLSCDAPSAWGGLYDFIICDEFTHWQKRELFDALFTGREKRPRSIMYIISNAGVLGTWQDEFVRRVKKMKSWYF